MATIHYEGINRSVENSDLDNTLLDVSMLNKIPHLHECGGNGRCTTCRVRVIEGARNLTKRTLIEKQTAAFRNWDPSVRLACQAYAKGDVRLQRLYGRRPRSTNFNSKQYHRELQKNAASRSCFAISETSRQWPRRIWRLTWLTCSIDSIQHWVIPY